MNCKLKQMADNLAQQATNATSYLEYSNAINRLHSMAEVLFALNADSDSRQYILDTATNLLAKPFQAA